MLSPHVPRVPPRPKRGIKRRNILTAPTQQGDTSTTISRGAIHKIKLNSSCTRLQNPKQSPKGKSAIHRCLPPQAWGRKRLTEKRGFPRLTFWRER
ncbi:hypothetical protein E2C01_076737 [Portunus trituberculatus]|uniref:Uncharacterized protein n=1 Tax=Portunus trituberculatus TaxID=210409 RepID=A0A5B7IDY9_PORTR|nr:hypothetical protein [Portunus trituberculatus]